MSSAGGYRPSRRSFIAGSLTATALGGQLRAEVNISMDHIALLGDSVFDNGAYVGGGIDVIGHLRQQMPSGWQASLLAVDGGRMADLPRQMAGLSQDATHLIISIGGNDALAYASVLDEPSRSIAESLLKLASIRAQFCRDYQAMLDGIGQMNRPAAVCTIYDPRYPDQVERTVGTTALMVLNDCIIREAGIRGVPVLDLRTICNEDQDFANAIEPSDQGGRKIARAIISLVAEHDFGRRRTAIYAG